MPFSRSLLKNRQAMLTPSVSVATATGVPLQLVAAPELPGKYVAHDEMSFIYPQIPGILKMRTVVRKSEPSFAAVGYQPKSMKNTISSGATIPSLQLTSTDAEDKISDQLLQTQATFQALSEFSPPDEISAILGRYFGCIDIKCFFRAYSCCCCCMHFTTVAGYGE